MTDLMIGSLEICGFTFCKLTTLEEVQNYFGEKIRLEKLASGFKVKLKRYYNISADIYVYAFNFDNEGLLTDYSLIPAVPPTIIDRGNGEIPKYKLEVAKRWLRNMIPVEPQTLNENAIGYSFESVGYYASVLKDSHYGIVGGNITVLFRKV